MTAWRYGPVYRDKAYIFDHITRSEHSLRLACAKPSRARTGRCAGRRLSPRGPRRGRPDGQPLRPASPAHCSLELAQGTRRSAQATPSKYLSSDDPVSPEASSATVHDVTALAGGGAGTRRAVGCPEALQNLPPPPRGLRLASARDWRRRRRGRAAQCGKGSYIQRERVDASFCGGSEKGVGILTAARLYLVDTLGDRPLADSNHANEALRLRGEAEPQWSISTWTSGDAGHLNLKAQRRQHGAAQRRLPPAALTADSVVDAAVRWFWKEGGGAAGARLLAPANPGHQRSAVRLVTVTSSGFNHRFFCGNDARTAGRGARRHSGGCSVRRTQGDIALP